MRRTGPAAAHNEGPRIAPGPLAGSCYLLIGLRVNDDLAGVRARLEVVHIQTHVVGVKPGSGAADLNGGGILTDDRRVSTPVDLRVDRDAEVGQRRVVDLERLTTVRVVRAVGGVVHRDGLLRVVADVTGRDGLGDRVAGERQTTEAGHPIGVGGNRRTAGRQITTGDHEINA